MDRQTKTSIATLMFVAFMIGTDFTGALLLIPPIEKEFSADITTTQWILNIYALAISMFLVSGGRLADMYGRRRLMLIGLTVFMLGSLGCYLAPSMGLLIACRAIQGLGAAIVWPCVLALGTNLANKDERGLVVGLLMAGITMGNVIGPLIGGVVVTLGDWRLFFFVNAAMAIASAFFMWRINLEEMRGQANERIDYAGMVVLSAAILAVLYGLDVGADWGWTSAPLIGLFAISLALFVIFPFVERHAVDPMVAPPMMRNGQFILALLTNGLVMPSTFIAFLYFPQYMQRALGWSVLQSSFGILPLMALLAVGSIFSGKFYKAVGPKKLLLAGYVLGALGSAWVAVFFVASWGYWAIVPPMLLIGFGTAICVGSAGTVAVSAVAPERAGLAGGLSFMVHLVIGALGVAGATAIMYSTLGANGAGSNALEAFASGMSKAYWLALVAAVIGIFVVLAIDEEKLHAVDT